LRKYITTHSSQQFQSPPIDPASTPTSCGTFLCIGESHLPKVSCQFNGMIAAFNGLRHSCRLFGARSGWPSRFRPRPPPTAPTPARPTMSRRFLYSRRYRSACAPVSPSCALLGRLQLREERPSPPSWFLAKLSHRCCNSAFGQVRSAKPTHGNPNSVYR
jgi:hypothetical protein